MFDKIHEQMQLRVIREVAGTREIPNQNGLTFNWNGQTLLYFQSQSLKGCHFFYTTCLGEGGLEGMSGGVGFFFLEGGYEIGGELNWLGRGIDFPYTTLALTLFPPWG